YRAPADLRAEIVRRIEVSEFGGAPSDLSRPKRGALARGGSIRGAFDRFWNRGGWLGHGGVFAAGVLVTALGASILHAMQREEGLLSALAGDHARALVSASAIEVASANTHTVKPWLSEKLGYSPGVYDIAETDFVLRGGRRGYLGREQLAVMVYSYKEHEIDVYALPAQGATRLPPGVHLIDGFNTVGWSINGIQYL